MYLCLVIDICLLFTEYALGVHYVPGTVGDAGHIVASIAGTAPAHVGLSVRGRASMCKRRREVRWGSLWKTYVA